jgi:hypothetical protein
MRTSATLFIATATAAVVIAASSGPLLARGGPPSIMDSPGYQRRLQESRQQLAEPSVQPSPAHRRKRHRH